MSLALQLARRWHMARHIPPRQMLRRLTLKSRFAVRPLLPPRRPAPAPLADPLPRPVFARRDLMAPAQGGFVLRLPWDERFVPEPVNWRQAPEAADPLLARAEHNNLHFMEFLEAADDRAFERLTVSWIQANPEHARGAAICAWRPYNLALRVVVWMQELARRQGRLDPGVVTTIRLSLADQLTFLAGHLETDLRGNHLIKNVKALLWGTACFGGEAAAGWRRLGERHLAAELAEQVLPDGCHYERSPAYHCQVLADFIECREVLEAGPLRTKLDAAVQRMLKVVRLLSHPDGQVAPLNDGGLTMAWPPQTLAEAWAGLTGERIDLEPGVFALLDAGYYGLATADERVIVDCGPLGPSYLAGHGHGDVLALEWSTRGRRILVDQGTYQYVDGPRRHESRATSSHNTVTIAAQNQSDFYGAFRCGRRARPELRGFDVEGTSFRFEGSHDGYRHLDGAPRPVRRIDARPGRLDIHDRIEGGAGQEAEAAWLLHPDCRIERVDERRLRLRHGPVTIAVEASRPLRVVDAAWFPDLYVAKPTRRLIAALAPDLATSFVRLDAGDPA